MNESPAELPTIDPQLATDREHLKLLAIFYYMLGGITIFFSCFGLFHFFFGLAMVFFGDSFHGRHGQPDLPPLFFGLLFSFIGVMIVLTGWIIGGLTLFAARSIQLRKRRTFTLVIAALNCLNCMFMPFGAVLCAFTFVILTRDSVRRVY
jgi:hypothetical protein